MAPCIQTSDAHPASSPARGRARRFLVAVLALIAFFGVAVGLQKLAGAYGSELSGYPDESSHFVAGAMVESYLTTFPFQPMVPFAKEFYIHRPKVAIGHWPPVLYLLEGIWFLVFHVSKLSALTLMALIAASVAASVCHVVRRRHGTPAGIAAGLLFLCLAFVQEQTSQVMADMLVTLFGFWAALSFADFLQGRRGRDVFRFAVFALLAIFTKNNGLYLAFLPVIAAALTRQLGVWRNPRLWLAALLVALPTGLWVVWSHRFVAGTWMETAGPEFFLRASRLDLISIGAILGPCFLILVAAGSLHDLIRRPSAKDLVSPALASAALSVLLFQSLVPAGIEPRFLLPAVAALIPLLFSGLMWLADSIGPRAVPRRVRAAVLLAIGALLSPHRTFAIPHKQYRGFSEVADFVQSQPLLKHGVVVVSSASDGEGLLISEIVMRYPSFEGYVLRSSKVLAQEDWLGRFYKSRFQSADEVFQYLDTMGVNLLVIEDQAGVRAPEHQALLLHVMDKEHLDQWRSAGTFPQRFPTDLKGSRILVYQRIDQLVRSDEEVHRDMQAVLGRILGE